MRAFLVALLLVILSAEAQLPLSNEEKEFQWLLRILAFQKDGDQAIVKAEIAKFFTQYPNSSYNDGLQLILADFDWEQKKYEVALEKYTALQNGRYKNEVAPKRLDCLYQLKQYEAIVDDAHGEDPTCCYYYAEAFYHLQDYAKATEWYNKLIGTKLEIMGLLPLSEIKNRIGSHLETAETLLFIGHRDPERRREMLERASNSVLFHALSLFDLEEHATFIEQSAILKSALPMDYQPILDFYRGRAFFILGKNEEAKNAATSFLLSSSKSILDPPSDKEVFLIAIITSCILEQLDQAASFAKAFEKKYPDMAPVVELLQRHEKPAFRLYGARLAFYKIPFAQRSVEDDETMNVLNALKDLQVNRQFKQEPIHLEAAIDYAAIRSSLEPPKRQKAQQHLLLLRVKTEFTGEEGLFAKEYQKNRRENQELTAVYKAYMMLIDAHILRLEAEIAREKGELLDAEIKEEAATALYKNLLQGKFAVSQYLRNQAESSLKNESL